MTHAPPEVILPLLIATGACKCALLPQAYLPTSGIDTNLHFPAKKPLWSQSQATIGYGVPPAIPRVHHLLHCVPKKYLPLLVFFFFSETIRKTGREAWEVKVDFFSQMCQVPLKIQHVLSDKRRYDGFWPEIPGHRLSQVPSSLMVTVAASGLELTCSTSIIGDTPLKL